MMCAPVTSDDFWNSVDNFHECLLREQRVKCFAKSFADNDVVSPSSADKPEVAVPNAEMTEKGLDR